MAWQKKSFLQDLVLSMSRNAAAFSSPFMGSTMMIIILLPFHSFWQLTKLFSASTEVEGCCHHLAWQKPSFNLILALILGGIPLENISHDDEKETTRCVLFSHLGHFEDYGLCSQYIVKSEDKVPCKKPLFSSTKLARGKSVTFLRRCPFVVVSGCSSSLFQKS